MKTKTVLAIATALLAMSSCDKFDRQYKTGELMSGTWKVSEIIIDDHDYCSPCHTESSPYTMQFNHCAAPPAVKECSGIATIDTTKISFKFHLDPDEKRPEHFFLNGAKFHIDELTKDVFVYSNKDGKTILKR